MNKQEYQYNFSAQHADTMYNQQQRRQKAGKTLAVLKDSLGDLNGLSLLDIGCSTGIMTALYGPAFGRVTGIDIDEPAVNFAIKNNTEQNIEYHVRDAMNTGFASESFDVITCSHIYEHVPNARKMMDEIFRLLRPGGACYFVAGNRLNLIEGHYKLPFLSIMPKRVAHLYLRLLSRGAHYYETHLTLWSLRELVKDFEILDYTRKIIADPEKFSATELVTPNSLTQKIGLWVVKWFYFLVPNYVWVLVKKVERE